MGRYQADLNTLISLVQSPYQELQLQGVKAMSIVSDPNFPQADKYVIQFENHIKGLIEITLARNKTAQFKNYSLQTIANLCIRENLKPALVYNKCIDVLCYHLKN